MRTPLGQRIWMGFTDSAGQKGRELLLRVRDKGPGTEASGGKSIREGVGIRATRERLQALYGEGHVFAIHEPPNGGFEVEIRIPFSVQPRPLIYELES
jgi:two-component system LytT family sensor kinase